MTQRRTWSLYLVRCGRGSLYTGIAVDVPRRFEEHRAGGARAAKYLRGRGPLKLVYQRAVGSQSDAARAEMAVKKLGRARKEDLIAGRIRMRDIVPAERATAAVV